MCGRYYVPSEEESIEIREIIAEVNRRHAGNPVPDIKTGEIFPTNVVPIVTSEGAQAMRWGFARWDGKGVLINSRSEGILDSKIFRKSALESRCLVPAAYYFEWQGQGKEKAKQKIGLSGKKAMYMAGIYRRETGQEFPVFSIITREASPDIAHIHDRMPVILDGDIAKAWLKADAAVDELLAKAQTKVEFEPASEKKEQVEQMGFF